MLSAVQDSSANRNAIISSSSGNLPRDGQAGCKLQGLPYRHPWVDSAGRLSFPALDRWAPGQSSLAHVVTEAASSLSGQTARADSSPSPSRSGT